jgi:PiT family inorganic phosphate transporter
VEVGKLLNNGFKITKVTYFEGVAAETTGALTLILQILKIGKYHSHYYRFYWGWINKRVSAVRWGVTVSLIWAWVLNSSISRY